MLNWYFYLTLSRGRKKKVDYSHSIWTVKARLHSSPFSIYFCSFHWYQKFQKPCSVALYSADKPIISWIIYNIYFCCCFCYKQVVPWCVQVKIRLTILKAGSDLLFVFKHSAKNVLSFSAIWWERGAKKNISFPQKSIGWNTTSF